MVDCRFGAEKPAAIRETVGRDVDDPHDPGPVETKAHHIAPGRGEPAKNLCRQLARADHPVIGLAPGAAFAGCPQAQRISYNFV